MIVGPVLAHLDALQSDVSMSGLPSDRVRLHRAIADTSSGVRQAIVLADLAGAYAGAETSEQAASTLGEAHDLAIEVRYPMAMQRIMGTRAV
jgi:hypothetical protein